MINVFKGPFGYGYIFIYIVTIIWMIHFVYRIIMKDKIKKLEIIFFAYLLFIYIHTIIDFIR